MGRKYFHIFMATNWVATLIGFWASPETQTKPTLESLSDLVGAHNPEDSCTSISVAVGIHTSYHM